MQVRWRGDFLRHQCLPEDISEQRKRVLRDAMRLRGKRSTLKDTEYQRLCVGIERRMTQLIEASWNNGEAKRLVKRLKQHREELLVFLYHADVPFDNNHAERTIRNAVVMRKNSYCNRSIEGAATQAILMSVFQTLKQRNAHVTATIVKALRQYLKTKKCPPWQHYSKIWLNSGKSLNLFAILRN